MIIAQQGYEGSYHDIVRNYLDPDSEMLGLPNFHDTVSAVHEGRAEVGIIATENSIYGNTQGALEIRTNFDDLVIIGDSTLDITHKLYGSKVVKEIHSHPVALGQCRETIRRLYPDAKVVESIDTASAAQYVAERARSGDHTIAAIASSAMGILIPELNVIQIRMNDLEPNETRFVVFTRKDNVNTDTTVDADTTIARLYIPDTRDSLLHTLQILSNLDISYTSIEANARRVDSRSGTIVTPIEFKHSWHDDRMRQAEEELKAIGVSLRNLGSFVSGKIIKV